MAKMNLTSMSVDALLTLRDDIGKMLSRKANELKRQLSRLASGATSRGSAPRRRGPKKGRKVPPKYRGPRGETWSGRGLRPRWLTAALKSGHKVDDFLIAKRAGSKGKRKARAG
jgi:DNA-binding protein H-NS